MREQCLRNVSKAEALALLNLHQCRSFFRGEFEHSLFRNLNNGNRIRCSPGTGTTHHTFKGNPLESMTASKVRSSDRTASDSVAILRG
jgi:hypothetical protein